MIYLRKVKQTLKLKLTEPLFRPAVSGHVPVGVFGGFAGILLLIDMIDQLRRSAVSLRQAAYLSLLNVPESLYQILPLLMLLTGIALFLALARSSELVVVRAAGRSGLSCWRPWRWLRCSALRSDNPEPIGCGHLENL